MNFSDLGLDHPKLLAAIADAGWASPTPIQEQAIAAVLRGHDVWATAPTGSGKTLAFALPLVQGLAPGLVARRGQRLAVRGLVLVPTRELAAQVGQVMTDLAYPMGLRVVVAYGGVSINPQMMALRGGADVVVATPGRLLDLLQHNALSLGQVAHLVLDEADRLLDAGFAQEWAALLAHLPTHRQTLLFSATDSPEVQRLAATELREPQRVVVLSGHGPEHEGSPTQRADERTVPHADIAQRAIAVDAARRTALLKQLIQQQGWGRVMVFVATRYASVHVAEKLHRAGIEATPFHGEMSQGMRQKVLAAFKSGEWPVVVTTDLAARGIDVADVSAVVNYDLPRSANDYTHRIGRTGRAGAQGQAVSFVTADMQMHWQLIRQREQLEMPLEVVPGFEPVDEPPAPVAPNSNGGIKGKRPSKKDKLRAAAARQSSVG